MSAELAVLIVDDEAAVARALERLLGSRGFTTRVVATPAAAIAAVHEETFGAVISDMNFSPALTDGAEGEGLFMALREIDPELPVVLMTAWASLEKAVALVRVGAADYVEKPWDPDKLLPMVKNLIELRRTRLENRRLVGDRDREVDELSSRFDLTGLIYCAPAMHRAVALAAQVARSDAPVLVTGENGSGKEVIAEIIQRNSTVKTGPFIKVNAGALPSELLEAELFGAEAGAFTGAAKTREGRFEAADGGTLFLDEVGNLSAHGQAALLRVLQTGEFERLGSSKTRKVKVRLISATNTDLAATIKAGGFREDLYYRLNVIEIRLPPLRERVEDIAPLALHFLKLHGAGRPLRLDDDAVAGMRAWPWPGNVRELQNRAQRAAIVCASDVITLEDLGLHRTPSSSSEEPAVELDASEGQRIERALARHAGVVAHAAAELGLSRQALYRRMRRFGLEVERRVRSDEPSAA
ncbi:MAG: sigma-54 dependent transcriptional regulator [Deltaproteobacteria bacterium]|nr:sigma-54 dependent transcriptional regulator [Deltaproteobacteria bacterium]